MERLDELAAQRALVQAGVEIDMSERRSYIEIAAALGVPLVRTEVIALPETEV